MTGAQETMKTQIVAIYKVTHKSYTLGQPKLLLDDQSKSPTSEVTDGIFPFSQSFTHGPGA